MRPVRQIVPRATPGTRWSQTPLGWAVADDPTCGSPLLPNRHARSEVRQQAPQSLVVEHRNHSLCEDVQMGSAEERESLLLPRLAARRAICEALRLEFIVVSTCKGQPRNLIYYPIGTALTVPSNDSGGDSTSDTLLSCSRLTLVNCELFPPGFEAR